jgi:hypothetical protein
MFKTEKKIEELEAKIDELTRFNAALTERVLKLAALVHELSDKVLINTEAIFGDNDE